MPNATSSTANSALRVPAATPSSRMASSAMLSVPVAAYTSAMPIRKIIDDTIDTIT